ncbi:hypothetical protein [Acidianus sp. HS-5]|uniref:hypothetical protein n=1 Tax=Acidianus sp. HS-5 TaxID=2886040 RepID=UPI001F19DC2B|nr:hypothetical protein [Acidianus sp. HS-5]
MKLRLEITLGSLLFISSFFPHYCLSLLAIISAAVILKLKYFPPFVSALLLLSSPFHALLALFSFPLLYLDRKSSLSFSLATLFSLLTQNYLILFLAGALEKKGLIISGIMFLILSAVLSMNSLGNIAYFLLISGVISAIIEGRISLRTSAVIYLSALAFYFKLPFLIPAIVSFSPLVSLLYSPFYPYFAIISLKYARSFKKVKILNYLPPLFSFINPSLSISSLYDVVKGKELFLYILLPFFSLVYFVIEGEYLQEEILFFSLAILFIVNMFRSQYKPIVSFIEKYYYFFISALLIFISVKFFFFDLHILTPLILSSIAISLPEFKISVYPLFASLLSLINPFVGISAVQRLSPLFVLIPLLFYFEFHYSAYSVIFYMIGGALSIFIVKDIKLKKLKVFVILSLLFVLNALLLYGNYFSIIAAAVSIIFLFFFKRELRLSEILALYFSSFPLSFISGFFIPLKGRISLCVILVTEAVIAILIMKTVPITSPILTHILYHV